jgi:hypothetical protein
MDPRIRIHPKMSWIRNTGYMPCIPGGQIHDVHYAFMAQYEGIQTPMDVVLACGVNNMPTTDTAEERDRERPSCLILLQLVL